MVVVNALVPVFGLIFLGWLLGARRVIPVEGQQTLGIITFKLFMPVLLFSGLARADLGEALSPLLLIRYYLPACIVFILVNLLMHRRLGRPSSMGLAASYSNNVLVGIPLITVMLGADSLVYLFAILAFHSLLLFTLQSIYNAFWDNQSDGRIDFRGLLASLANPLIIGLFIGGLVNLSGIPIPQPLWHIVEMLAAAALPVALLMLGLNLASYRLYLSGTMATLTAAKLVIFPLLVLGVGWLIPGLSAEARTVLVLMAACPTGINVLAFAMGREDTRVLGSVIFLSTVISAVTLPVWLMILVD